MSVQKDLRLSSILIDWYKVNKRELPWRETSDPYVIWVSEVILQQTRVVQGYDYFNRFISDYPTVDKLAIADEEEILKLWQGLGYYSRARNLHAAAKMVMSKFSGIFPSNYKDVLTLKGVGEYTAAAIVSFAFDQPYAVVDGNVYRVLSRLFAIDTPINSTAGKKLFAELAQELLDERDAGTHNQAIMEFGALQCVPVSPDCQSCPASALCVAFAENLVSSLPVKEKKLKVRTRYFNYIDVRFGEDNMLLCKRTQKDVWQNLYELPLIESDQELGVEDLVQDEKFVLLVGGKNKVEIKCVTTMKHVLSHQTIYATFYRVDVDNLQRCNNCHTIKVAEVNDFPVSRLVHRYLELL